MDVGSLGKHLRFLCGDGVCVARGAAVGFCPTTERSCRFLVFFVPCEKCKACGLHREYNNSCFSSVYCRLFKMQALLFGEEIEYRKVWSRARCADVLFQSRFVRILVHSYLLCNACLRRPPQARVLFMVSSWVCQHVCVETL